MARHSLSLNCPPSLSLGGAIDAQTSASSLALTIQRRQVATKQTRGGLDDPSARFAPLPGIACQLDVLSYSDVKGTSLSNAHEDALPSSFWSVFEAFEPCAHRKHVRLNECSRKGNHDPGQTSL
jgi:hypothetical protein